MSSHTVCLAAVLVLGVSTVILADHTDSAPKEWTGKPWLGKWVSTDRLENWDAFVEALGFSVERFGGNHKTVHKLWKQGDHYHHQISIKDKGYKQEVQFKIGEEGTAHYNISAGDAPPVLSPAIKFKYTEDGEKLVSTISVHGKVITDTYEVKLDELEKTYKIDTVTAKRWFRKQAAELYSA